MKSLLSLALVALLATVSVAQEEKQADADKILRSVQKICPVSGNALGEDAIKVEHDGQSMFVCCAGCKDKAPGEKHMKKIMARMAKAQGTCPIMKTKAVKATSKMTMVNGQPVFACCARCVGKVKSDGDAALKTVHANYKTFLSDESLVAAQKICPVSGNELGEGAIKTTTADGETVFVCCKGCKGKEFDEKHWATVLSNLAEAQGTCPIMNKPISADKKFTVVNGRRIFVCCPPCIKKIEADPDTFVAKLNDQIAASGSDK